MPNLEQVTTPHFWVCKCEGDFIKQDAATKHCPSCNEHADNSPDAPVEYVNAFYGGAKVCEKCGSTDVFSSPGGTGYGVHGEQDFPGWYHCRNCGHKDEY